MNNEYLIINSNILNSKIDKVIYINLKERTDRNLKCLEILTKLFDKDKIIRFDAIKHEKGYIGCYKSHIGCLEIILENKEW